MLERSVKEGQIYRHFKGSLHKIICVAKDSESLEDMVVYNHIEDGSIWVRSKDMFLSLVDHNKYPDVKQMYRFELCEEENN